MVRLSRARAGSDEALIRIAPLGLTVRVRASGLGPPGAPVLVEALNAAGGGPPLWRRAEAEIFQIVTGRYLFEVDGERFIARRGDVVSVPPGAVRGCVNVTGTGARQLIVVCPGIDAHAFFGELAQALALAARRPLPERAAVLQTFGARWRVDFVGPPLAPGDDAPAAARPPGGTLRAVDVREERP